MSLVRDTMIALLVLCVIGATVAGFADFGPNRQELASVTTRLFLVGAIGSAITLGLLEWFESRLDG